MRTIPPVREIVIVVADLYLPAEAGGSWSVGASGAMRGLEHAARFGATSVLERGWRDRLARWLGRDDLAQAAPATVAAAGLQTGEAQMAWIATPVHLIASLTSLHLDHRSILRPPRSELERLAQDFPAAFRDSGFSLQPLPCGDFLLLGPSMPQALTTEPARSLVGGVAESLPGGAGAPLLRRLGAEIEMWLHGHPLSEIRASRGEPPVSALWLWGGGPTERPPTDHSRGAELELAFGSDAYVRGLWHLQGGEMRPLPQQLHDIFSYPRAQRAALVMEVAQVLHSNPKWNVLEAVAELDRRFVWPALQALNRGAVASVLILANDRQLLVRSCDQLKIWRRSRPGLKGLQ